MKKFFLLLFAAAAFAACNDDDGEPKIRYATINDGIVNGLMQGINMHFYGTATVTEEQQNSTYTDNEAYFEFAGGPENFSLYMHKTRFAANMPGVEMRLQTVTYTPKGDKSLNFVREEIIPSALKENNEGGGSSYRPVERYKITNLTGAIDGVDCRVSFTCAGVFQVIYEGRLIIKE